MNCLTYCLQIKPHNDQFLHVFMENANQNGAKNVKMTSLFLKSRYCEYPALLYSDSDIERILDFDWSIAVPYASVQTGV